PDCMLGGLLLIPKTIICRFHESSPGYAIRIELSMSRDCKRRKGFSLLERQEFKLDSKLTANAIIEGPEIRARRVILQLTRIPVIGDIEYLETNPTFIVLSKDGNGDIFHYLHVERGKTWQPAGGISYTHEVLLLIYE